MPKLERERLTGVIFFPKSAEECFMDAMLDLGLSAKEDIKDCLRRSEKGRRRLPRAYIKAEGQVFRIAKNLACELEGEVPDGAGVTFETPKVQRGKYRWAYDIKPTWKPKKKK